MLSNYIEQLFKLDNYYDGLIVTDNKGYIEFFMTYRPDIRRYFNPLIQLCRFAQEVQARS